MGPLNVVGRMLVRAQKGVCTDKRAGRVGRRGLGGEACTYVGSLRLHGRLWGCGSLDEESESGRYEPPDASWIGLSGRAGEGKAGAI